MNTNTQEGLLALSDEQIVQDGRVFAANCEYQNGRCVRMDFTPHRLVAFVRAALATPPRDGKPDWLLQLQDRERRHALSGDEGDRQYAAGIREAMTAYALNATPPREAAGGLPEGQIKEAVSTAQRLVDKYVGVVRRHIRNESTLLDKEQAWSDAMKAIEAVGMLAATTSAPSEAAGSNT